MNRLRFPLDDVHLASAIKKIERSLEEFKGLPLDAKTKAVIKVEALHILRETEWLADPCWKGEIDIDLVEAPDYVLHVLFQPKTDQATEVLKDAFKIAYYEEANHEHVRS
jgi:hypothetical protein